MNHSITQSLIRVPNYISPSDFDPKSYVSAIREANTIFQDYVGDKLKRAFPDYDGSFVIVTTGSDGRLEKGPYETSKLEFIVISRDSRNSMIKPMLELLAEMQPGELDKFVENKNLETDEMSTYNGDRSRTFPNRILDASYLYGEENIIQNARRKMFNEFTGVRGRGIYERVRDRKKEYRQIILKDGAQSFKGDVLKHFEFGDNTVKANFDPKKGTFGFKLGPLRYIQITMMNELARYYRGLDEDTRERKIGILTSLPTNTEQRLYTLAAYRGLNLGDSETKSLVDVYSYFVWAYNLSQHHFQKDGVTELEFDKQDVKNRLDELIGILKITEKKPLIKL